MSQPGSSVRPDNKPSAGLGGAVLGNRYCQSRPRPLPAGRGGCQRTKCAGGWRRCAVACRRDSERRSAMAGPRTSRRARNLRAAQQAVQKIRETTGVGQEAAIARLKAAGVAVSRARRELGLLRPARGANPAAVVQMLVGRGVDRRFAWYAVSGGARLTAPGVTPPAAPRRAPPPPPVPRVTPTPPRRR